MHQKSERLETLRSDKEKLLYFAKEINEAVETL